MILTNALCALSQALDLRWLEANVRSRVMQLVQRHSITLPDYKPPGSTSTTGDDLWGFIPWYDAAYCPQRVAGIILDSRLGPVNHIKRDEFINEMASEMETLMADLSGGKFIQEVTTASGKGTPTSTYISSSQVKTTRCTSILSLPVHRAFHYH